MTKAFSRSALMAVATLALAAGTPTLLAQQNPNAARQAEQARLSKLPVPRTADGRIALNNTPTVKGVWIGGSLNFCNGSRVVGPRSLNPGATGGPGGVSDAAAAAVPRFALPPALGSGCTPVPYQPWTLALSEDRRLNELEPHTRCKPSGGPRQWLTPYGAEIVELPEMKVAYIFDIGGPHTFRTIYMDGRKHPENLTPSYYGHSIGWWEGDTFVVDSIGFNERFWIDRSQLPHTDRLHLIEKYTRTAYNQMKYELTVDDPGAYTAPFTATSNLRWEEGTELFEYVCQQDNYAHELMVGTGTSVDRTSPIVP